MVFFFFLRSHILQADSEYVYKSWIEALQQGIEDAIRNRPQQKTNQNDDDSNDLNEQFQIPKIKKSK